MPKKSRTEATADGAMADAVIYDELTMAIGRRLLDDGLTPTNEAFAALAQNDGDCRTPDDRARAFGRLAVDGANIVMIVQARDLQRLVTRHLTHRRPEEAHFERMRLAAMQAWLDADRAALENAVRTMKMGVKD